MIKNYFLNINIWQIQLRSVILGIMRPLAKYKQKDRMGCFIFEKPTEADILAAQAGLIEMTGIIESNEYDVVILDEANIAVYYNLITVKELIAAITKRNERTEIIITGRYATPEIMDFADLVTEMKEVKHYYQQGVQARVGIEK